MSRWPEIMKRAALSALLVLGAVGAAHAEYDTLTPSKKSDFGRPGGYLSVGAAGATQMFTGAYDFGSLDVSQAIIIGIRGGGRLNRVVAIDFSLDYSVRGFEVEIPGVTTAEARSLTGFGNLKLYPLAGRVQPYVLGGAGFLLGALDCTTSSGATVSCSGSGFYDQEFVFAGRAGGGLDIYLTRILALSAEVAYVIPTGSLSDLNYLQYGGYVTFRF